MKICILASLIFALTLFGCQSTELSDCFEATDATKLKRGYCQAEGYIVLVTGTYFLAEIEDGESSEYLIGLTDSAKNWTNFMQENVGEKVYVRGWYERAQATDIDLIEIEEINRVGQK